MPGIETRPTLRPLYLQVRDLLVHQITDGKWKPGSTLPNEGLLAQQLGTSIGTVRKALDIMEDERIVLRRQGRGTFVHDPSQQPFQFKSFVNASGQRFVDVKRGKCMSNVAATDEDSKRLGIAPGAEVIRIERARLHDGKVYLTEECKLPARFFGSLPNAPTDYRLPELAQQNGHIVSHAEEVVNAIAATVTDADELSVEVGSPILALDRTIYSERLEILEWRVARCVLRSIRFVVRYE